MSGTVQIRMDDDLIIKSDTLLPQMTEDEILKKLEKSREHVAEGKFRNAEEMISDMRKKYDL
ncbi:MAG: hypothetical protein K5985_06645 [Lachnospiraceae bacterium]|nr:hypothetical protein [Lachnospiraceae bacterium]